MKRLKARAKAPVLVVAIDKAWALRGVKNASGIDAFEMLCEALTTVNSFRAVRRANGRIFAVLVDTSPHLHNAVLESSARSRSGKKAMFPPFILTQSMDVMLSTSDSSCTSQSRVLCTDPERTWEALVSMGRPRFTAWRHSSVVLDRVREQTTQNRASGRALHYVTYKSDVHICSYSSDLMLTLGASRGWYQLCPGCLQFGKTCGYGWQSK
jgi:hypothetical protein